MLSPDAIDEILKHLPYEDAINTALVSKQFAIQSRDWHYWKQRAYEDFKFPYDLFTMFHRFDPRVVYLFVQQIYEHPNHGLDYAVQENIPPLVTYVMSHTQVTEVNYAIAIAIQQGNLSLVQYLVQESLLINKNEKRVDLDLDAHVHIVGQCQQTIIVEYLHCVARDSQDPAGHGLLLDNVLSGASAGGDLAIMRYAFRQGCLILTLD